MPRHADADADADALAVVATASATATATPSVKRASLRSKDSTYGAAYPLILEHILDKPGTFKIPLRTMYLTNAAAQPGHLPAEWSEALTPDNKSRSPKSASSSEPSSPGEIRQQAATAQFVSSLMDHISRLPSHPCSLPPVFLTSFVRRCFPAELYLVDFPQALNGIDYLQDLDTRRRKDIGAAKRKLGSGLSRKSGLDSMSKLSPGIATWIREMDNSERKAEALFTQLYIALRRWVLINEFSLPPFNRHNALAMLNTLYPPFASSHTPPTAALTPSVLAKQRTGFLSYITAIEARGTSVLKPLMEQGKRPGIDPKDGTGWPSVAATLDQYLRVTNRIIDDCSYITSGEDLESLATRSPQLRQQASQQGQQKRKVDSGIGGVSASSAARTISRNAGSPPVYTFGLNQNLTHPSALTSNQPYTASDISKKSNQQVAYPLGPDDLSARTSTHKSNQSSFDSSISKQSNPPPAYQSGSSAGPARTSAHSRNKSSTSSSASHPGDRNKPLPSPPAGATVFVSPANANQSVKNFSRIERIAHELRRIKSRQKLRADDGKQNERRDNLDDPTESEDKENVNLAKVQTLTPTDTTSTGGDGRRGGSSSKKYNWVARMTPTPHRDNTSSTSAAALVQATAPYNPKHGFHDPPPPNTETTSHPPHPPAAAPAPTTSPARRGRSARRLPSFGDLRRLASRSKTRERERERETGGDFAALESGPVIVPGLGRGEDAFDKYEMRRQRALYEARMERASRVGDAEGIGGGGW